MDIDVDAIDRHDTVHVETDVRCALAKNEAGGAACANHSPNGVGRPVHVSMIRHQYACERDNRHEWIRMRMGRVYVMQAI